jgi:hypothetical protein
MLPSPLFKTTILAAALAALAACDTGLGTEISRNAAKSVVNDVIEDKAPGVNAEPVTDCIIDNASGSEIVDIAGAAVTGVTDQTVALVLEIATRSGTIECLIENVGPIVLAELAMAGI